MTYAGIATFDGLGGAACKVAWRYVPGVARSFAAHEINTQDDLAEVVQDCYDSAISEIEHETQRGTVFPDVAKEVQTRFACALASLDARTSCVAIDPARLA